MIAGRRKYVDELETSNRISADLSQTRNHSMTRDCKEALNRDLPKPPITLFSRRDELGEVMMTEKKTTPTPKSLFLAIGVLTSGLVVIITIRSRRLLYDKLVQPLGTSPTETRVMESEYGTWVASSIPRVTVTMIRTVTLCLDHESVTGLRRRIPYRSHIGKAGLTKSFGNGTEKTLRN